MTLQQLEYILAVNQFRHFAKAAEYCRVTQPTLSAMIQKLEEELDTRIFDRSQQPVCPTPVGIHIIEQAQNILVQANRIKNIIEEEKIIKNTNEMQKNSTFYHILNFLGNFCNSDKLSVLKQQLIYSQNKHGKGYT